MALSFQKEVASSPLPLGVLDVRRKAQVARGGPQDHKGEAIGMRPEEFDLDRTIFKTVKSCVNRKVLWSRLAVTYYWSDAVVGQVSDLYSAVPRPLQHDQGLMEFMQNECDFRMEHADGSFMDHLQFCYEYGATHLKEYSPRPLFLHSIMGVGSNCFPMELSKVPKLQALLTKEEFMHVEAFPSILRLLYHGPLADELLNSTPERLTKLKSISFHRVLDNSSLSMSVEDFWQHLNYHMIHSLDFLPMSDWDSADGNNFLWTFKMLHTVLSRNGRLIAHVDMGLKPIAPQSAATSRLGTTLGGMVMSFLPARAQLSMARKQIAKFSEEVKHDVAYSLEWESKV